MKKVMIAYVSRTGNTAKMAEYIAEGIRFSGATAVTKKISETWPALTATSLVAPPITRT